MPELATPQTDTAIDRIASMLDDKGMLLPDATGFVEDSEPVLDAEPDEAPDESSASPDESEQSDQVDEDENEPDENPAIEPPKSWNAAGRKIFAELPPEAQQYITTREGQRDKEFNQRLNQLAEQRKTLESDLARTSTAQTEYAQTLNHLLSLTVPELQQFDSVDWMKLAQEDPARYVALTAQRDGLRQRVQFMQQQAQQASAATQAQHVQALRQHVADQQQKLVEAIPDFGDPAKAKGLIGDITDTIRPYGFTDAELASINDARFFRLLHRYAQLEKVEKARKTAQAKKGGAPAPRLMPVNAAQARDTSPQRKMRDQFAQLRKSGSAHDAARLIESIL